MAVIRPNQSSDGSHFIGFGPDFTSVGQFASHRRVPPGRRGEFGVVLRPGRWRSDISGYREIGVILFAFHNDPAVKARCLARLRSRRKAGKLVQNSGHGQGGAVWSILQSSDYARFQTELGIPEVLARLMDAVFYGLPEQESSNWPERLLEAIPVGRDLSRVGWQFLEWLLDDTLAETEISVDLSEAGRDHICFSHPVLDAMRENAMSLAEIIEPLTRGEPAGLDAIAAVGLSLPRDMTVADSAKLKEELEALEPMLDDAQMALLDAKVAVRDAWEEREEAETELELAAEAKAEVEALNAAIESLEASVFLDVEPSIALMESARGALRAWADEVAAESESVRAAAKSDVARAIAESAERSVEVSCSPCGEVDETWDAFEEKDRAWDEISSKLLELVADQELPNEGQGLNDQPLPMSLISIDSDEAIPF